MAKACGFKPPWKRKMSTPWPTQIPPCSFDSDTGIYRVKCGPYAWLSAYHGIPGAMEVDTQTTVVQQNAKCLNPRPELGAACWIQRFRIKQPLVQEDTFLEIQDACHGCEDRCVRLNCVGKRLIPRARASLTHVAALGAHGGLSLGWHCMESGCGQLLSPVRMANGVRHWCTRAATP